MQDGDADQLVVSMNPMPRKRGRGSCKEAGIGTGVGVSPCARLGRAGLAAWGCDAAELELAGLDHWGLIWTMKSLKNNPNYSD